MGSCFRELDLGDWICIAGGEKLDFRAYGRALSRLCIFRYWKYVAGKLFQAALQICKGAILDM